MKDSNIEPAGDDSCRQLWCAVLGLAIEEAQQKKPTFVERDWEAKARKLNEKPRVQPATAARLRASAYQSYQNSLREWETARSYIGSPSFREVCWLAGVDPQATEERVRRKMPEYLSA